MNWPATYIEDVNEVVEGKALLFQQRFGGDRFLVDLSQHLLCRLGQQRDIDRMSWHQFGDEFLVLERLRFGARVSDLKEVRTERVPQRALAIVVNDAAHLGDRVRFESLQEFGHEQET